MLKQPYKQKAAKRVLEFFTAQVNNDHTRKAYMKATRRFAALCDEKGIGKLAVFKSQTSLSPILNSWAGNDDPSRQMVQVRRILEGCSRQVLHLKAKNLMGPSEEVDR